MRKILLIPTWMTSLRFYGDDSDFEIIRGKLDFDVGETDFVMGYSLGALSVLQDVDRIKGKIILINPPLPKRSLVAWIYGWIRYVISEGLFLKRQRFSTNPAMILFTLSRSIEFFKIDFTESIEKIADRLIIVRGKNDKFFCDSKAVKFINDKGIKLIEAEGGHNWSENIEKKLQQLIS